MKCVCGYERIKEDAQGKGVGSLNFIHLGTVTGVTERESNFYEKYACPKCGTLKIELEGG
jgi:hypothetical protein